MQVMRPGAPPSVSNLPSAMAFSQVTDNKHDGHADGRLNDKFDIAGQIVGGSYE